MSAVSACDAPVTDASRIDVQIDAAPAPSRDALVEWARAAMAGDVRGLCIRVVDETEARGLNARFRGARKATNVLSFAADMPDTLGDIAICAAVVVREAQAQNKLLDAHFAHMVVHGVLHLKGMDHDTETRAREMENAEIDILGTFGFGNPYLVSSSAF